MTNAGTQQLDAQGIAGMELKEGEAGNDHCFSLSLDLEPELEPIVKGCGFDSFGKRGSFGCMWTSVFAGQQYLMLQMTAAVSDMSRLLVQSSAVHRAWEDLARNVDALVAYIDVETDTAMQLYPLRASLLLPDSESLTFVDTDRFSMDLWVPELLELNR